MFLREQEVRLVLRVRVVLGTFFLQFGTFATRVAYRHAWRTVVFSDALVIGCRRSTSVNVKPMQFSIPFRSGELLARGGDGNTSTSRHLTLKSSHRRKCGDLECSR